ncbi:hypothetical protein MCHI_001959 [Candidatus Magnetoovum chiemensis]|nr:hypothetical protein MCHI_001959 [Candidatus Magnetoovum chiemensis]
MVSLESKDYDKFETHLDEIKESLRIKDDEQVELLIGIFESERKHAEALEEKYRTVKM